MANLRLIGAGLVLPAVLWSCGGVESSGDPDSGAKQASQTTSQPTSPVTSQPEKPAETASQPEEKPAEKPQAKAHPALTNPDLARETAPAKFRARFDTSKGPFVIEAVREWSPNGVDRLYNLIKIGYFTDIACFRAVPGFVVQFGMHGDPDINAHWSGDKIMDDPVLQSNRRGYLTFAMAGKDTRSNQLFVNLSDKNSRLDEMGFPAIARVVEGMAIVDSLYYGYGDGPPYGRGPQQGLIQSQGNDYLKRAFPKLDYITSASLLED